MEAIKFFSGTGGTSLYFNCSFREVRRAGSLGPRLACGVDGLGSQFI